MIIEVDTSSAVPPYEQVRVQIARMVARSVLGPGTRLPSIAQLAADLGLAPGTIARAYRELEAEGVVTSRRRVGTVVAARPKPTASSAGELDVAVADFARRLRQIGATPDEAIKRLRAAWRA